jgi:hypothetical protein
LTPQQLRALVDGHTAAESMDEARMIAGVRLAVWGDENAVRRHMRGLHGETRTDEHLAALGISRAELPPAEDDE